MNSTTDPPLMSGFGHLVEQEILPLHRYALALTPDRERGDDVVPDLPGLELWLFIVSPVAQFLDHRVEVRSAVGCGSRSCRGGEPFPCGREVGCMNHAPQ